MKNLGGGALEQFNASEGWLHRWKLRHGVRHVIIAREKPSADANAAQDFVKKFVYDPGVYKTPFWLQP